MCLMYCGLIIHETVVLNKLISYTPNILNFLNYKLIFNKEFFLIYLPLYLPMWLCDFEIKIRLSSEGNDDFKRLLSVEYKKVDEFRLLCVN